MQIKKCIDKEKCMSNNFVKNILIYQKLWLRIKPSSDKFNFAFRVFEKKKKEKNKAAALCNELFILKDFKAYLRSRRSRYVCYHFLGFTSILMPDFNTIVI